MKRLGATFFLFAFEDAIQLVPGTDDYLNCIWSCRWHKTMFKKYFWFIANVKFGDSKFSGWKEWSSAKAGYHIKCKADVHDHEQYQPVVFGGRSPSSLYTHFNTHNKVLKELVLYVI